jgi:hypothetical protein
MEKTAPPVQTTSQFTSVTHLRFGSDYGASTIHRQHQTIPHHQAIASTSILAEIARELTKIHPIKLEPSPTPPKFTSVIHRRFGSNYGASTIHQQHQMIPHHQAIAPISILVEIA